MTEHRSAFMAPFASLEVRGSGAGSDHYTLHGHAAVYNRRSVNLGGFSEVIAPGAFRDVLKAKPDVHLLWQHDGTKPLARTRGANPGLKLNEDGAGLHVWARVTPTTYAADLRSLIENDVVDQMSFAFTTPEDGSGEDWTSDESGAVTRTVRAVSGLFDVTVCARGAYQQTDVALGRSLFESARSAGIIHGWRDGVDVVPPVPALLEAAHHRDFEARKQAKLAEQSRDMDLAAAAAS